MARGLPLRKAHATLNRLAEGQLVAVALTAFDSETVVARLAQLGVAAAPIVSPNPDVKKIREAFGVSQSEFALRFGLEVDTVRNWEQGRYQPDPAARLLLKVIETSPAAVERALIGAQGFHSGERLAIAPSIVAPIAGE